MAYNLTGREVPLSIRDIAITISRIEKNMDKFSRYCDLTKPCRVCPIDEICALQTKYYLMLNNIREIYYDKSKDN